MKICKDCGKRLDVDMFSAGRRVCRPCRAAEERDRWQRERESKRPRISSSEAKWREQTARRRRVLGIKEETYRQLGPLALVLVLSRSDRVG